MIEEPSDMGDETEISRQKDLSEPKPLPDISFQAIMGATNPRTFRVVGKIAYQDVTVLIDSGNIHNFVDFGMVQRLGLQMECTVQFLVMVANGDKIQCLGKCSGLIIFIQNIIIWADYYVLPIAACSVVLEVQWLETIGPIMFNYQHLTMKFEWERIQRSLQGITRGPTTTLSKKEFGSWEGATYFLMVMMD